MGQERLNGLALLHSYYTFQVGIDDVIKGSISNIHGELSAQWLFVMSSMCVMKTQTTKRSHQTHLAIIDSEVQDQMLKKTLLRTAFN